MKRLVYFLTLISAFYARAGFAQSASCPGTGSLTREQWNNVAGSDLAAIPLATAPSSSSTLTQFEAVTSTDYNYGARLRGYVCPPTSGAYFFWLTGDDAAELYLSPDADPAHKASLIACNTWTGTPHDFDRYASQKSVAVQLQAGQRYYIEALHKQSWGPGYVSVAWQVPGATARQEPIPGANLLPYSPATPPPLDASKVRVTVTFASPPDPAQTTVRPAALLYNKARVLQYEEDDSPASSYTSTYPLFKAQSFTDGAGNARPYTAAVAINGHNPNLNNKEILLGGDGHDPSKLVWAQAQSLLDNGWDIENHSDLHTAPDPAKQVADLDALIAAQLKGYKPTVHIIPNDYKEYARAAFDAGYLAVSSQGTHDEGTPWEIPIVNPYVSDRIPLSSLPAPGTRLVYRRALADGASLAQLQALTDALLAPPTSTQRPGERFLQRVFTHGLDAGVLASWLAYTQQAAHDSLWVTTLREFAEYRRVRSQVVPSPPTYADRTLTVDLDYAALTPNTRFQNLSLLVKSPATITGITVTGALSSVNPATGLVNILRTPAASPPPPPAGTACTGTGSLSYERWNNVNGTSVADVPLTTAPSTSGPLPAFEYVTESTAANFHYGTRLRAYLCPPQTGSYRFFVVGNEAAELWLSRDETPANRQRIAFCSNYTSGPRDYGRYAGQQSDPINLVAGQRYYIEALHKQEWSEAYVSVAWLLPGAAALPTAPIPGANLLPYSATTANRGTAALAAASGSESLLAGPVLRVFPNPLGRQATVEFSVAKSGPVTLGLYNMQGQLVRQLYAGPAAAGAARTVVLALPAVSTGLYLLRLVTAKQVISQKVGYAGGD